MSVAARSLTTGFIVQLLCSSVTHDKSEFRNCCWEELDEARSTAGTEVSAGTQDLQAVVREL